MYEIKEGPSYSLAECGIFTALSLILVLISAYIPIIGSFTMLVWAAPLIALVIRRGAGYGMISAVAIFLLALFLTGPVWGSIAGLSVGLFGVIYGVCFKKGVSPFKTLFVGTIAAGFLAVISLALSTLVANVSIADYFKGVEDTFRDVFAIYEDMGIANQLLAEGMTMTQYIDTMVAMFYRILPGVFTVVIMAMAACNYVFSALLLKKFKFEIKSLPPFKEWHFPWWIMWGVAFILVGYLMGNQLNNDTYFTLALNLVYIYLPIFIISGISVLSFLFEAWKLKKGTQIVIWVISVVLLQFSMPFIVMIGAIDTLLDYRKMVRKIREQTTDKN